MSAINVALTGQPISAVSDGAAVVSAPKPLGGAAGQAAVSGGAPVEMNAGGAG